MSFIKCDKVTDFVMIEMEDGKSMVVELDEKAAPATVKNFKELVAQGFYDGLIFHRVIAGFMIQGGDPQGNGTGGSKQTVKGEFAVDRKSTRLNSSHRN